MTDTTALTLPVLPLLSGVVLPGMVVTIAVDSDRARAALQAAEGGDDLVLLVPDRGGGYAKVGTIAKIEQAGDLPNGVRGAVVTGRDRARIGVGVPGPGDALWVSAEVIDSTDTGSGPELDERARELRAAIQALLEQRGAPELVSSVRGMRDPGALADTAGYWPDLTIDQKVELLETLDVGERVELVLGWARDALAEHELKEQIRSDVSEGMEKSQREFLLRQQLAAIQKELGESDDDVIATYRERLDGVQVSDDVRDAIAKEIERLERTSEQSPEHGWIRTWLDTVTELPWNERSSDVHDIAEARSVLDADHTGLDDVKDRIVEFLAVRKLRSERGLDEQAETHRRTGGAILALVGPPGVGKTSLGESVARALGRSFVRVALGGVRDEAEIRGHRRTYVGAQPGRIVRALREAGTMNPVILLDEVDKVGADWRGDPSSALLEVLDPAQNHTFRDHYLEVDLDLSDVLFLATANVLDTIPGPLLDRLEIIQLDGYTEAEKVAIARDHLLGRQLAAAGLRDDEVGVSDEALSTIVADHTREPGVRGLERLIGKVLRKAATRVADGSVTPPLDIDGGDIADYLGRPRFHNETALATAVPGVVTGLAVTGAGGDVLFVEATAMDGEAGLTVTGQLGDVMKESAQLALSYVRSHREELGIPAEAFERRFHLHVPAGAVPKDGPSAGVTMTTALVSLLTGRPARSDVAMTGEITLQGRVLPIGGVRQKVLAAHRAGIKTVLVPALNEADLDDVPESVRDDVELLAISDLGAVIQTALTDPVVSSAA